MDGKSSQRRSELWTGAVVIWMTAYGCHEMKAEAARLSIYCCLDKPIKVSQIRQIVREAFEAIESKASG